MKFLHVADIHLDSPLRGLERYEGAPVLQIRSATRQALAQVVDLAISENGNKKIEALAKIDEKMRGRREGAPEIIHATIMPSEKPVNERD